MASIKDALCFGECDHVILDRFSVHSLYFEVTRIPVHCSPMTDLAAPAPKGWVGLDFQGEPGGQAEGPLNYGPVLEAKGNDNAVAQIPSAKHASSPMMRRLRALRRAPKDSAQGTGVGS